MFKGRRRGDIEPAQPLLPTINFARLLCDLCPEGVPHAGTSACENFALSAELIGLPPPAVPPVSNTGVHHELSERGAASGKAIK